MRIGRRVVKVLVWVWVLCLSILGGGLWFAYTYVTDSETAARLIRQYALRYLPGSDLEPGRVRIRPFAGVLTLEKGLVRQRIDGERFVALTLPWLHVQINPRKLIRGQLEVRDVVVTQPQLWLCHRRDGTWNLQGLLADPWPGPWLEKAPPIIIQNGTLGLILDPEEPGDASTPGPAAIDSAPEAGPVRAAASRIKDQAKAVILREATIKIEQVAGFLFRFEGSARGDVLDRLQITGSIDFQTGRIALDGSLSGLTLSEALRRRIPLAARPSMQALALNSGVVDIGPSRVSYDPTAAPGNRLHYSATARLRGGVWECPHLPFPVNNLWADVTVADGVLAIQRAEGLNGSTTLRAVGTVGLCDPRCGPLDLQINLTDLKLDDRLRSHTPAEYEDLWDVFQPRGQVDAELHVARAHPGEPLKFGAKVSCRDVSAKYRHFPYQLDHLTGELALEHNTLTVNLGTSSVGGPLQLKGTIENPGMDAVVQLDIQAESIPVDQTLLDALPDDVREVVDLFEPRGMVKAHATVHRRPTPDRRPEGLVAIDAEVDLSERCEIRWAGLKYPVRNLTGRLVLHPDEWIFSNMRGHNGQATITASGRVKKLSDQKLPGGDYPL
jgi:hypothetical protein